MSTRFSGAPYSRCKRQPWQSPLSPHCRSPILPLVDASVRTRLHRALGSIKSTLPTNQGRVSAAGCRPGLLGSVRRQQNGEKKTTNPAACSWRLYSLPPSFNHSSAAPSLVLPPSLPQRPPPAPPVPPPPLPCLALLPSAALFGVLITTAAAVQSSATQAPRFRPQYSGLDQGLGPRIQVWTRVQALGFKSRPVFQPQDSGKYSGYVLGFRPRGSGLILIHTNFWVSGYRKIPVHTLVG